MKNSLSAGDITFCGVRADFVACGEAAVFSISTVNLLVDTLSGRTVEAGFIPAAREYACIAGIIRYIRLLF